MLYALPRYAGHTPGGSVSQKDAWRQAKPEALAEQIVTFAMAGIHPVLTNAQVANGVKMMRATLERAGLDPRNCPGMRQYRRFRSHEQGQGRQNRRGHGGHGRGRCAGAGYETGKPVPESGATMCGGGYGFAPGEWTDDTCGAIAVAMGRSVPEEVAKGLLSWYWTRPPDIGITTRAVLSKVKSPAGMRSVSWTHAVRQDVGRSPRIRSGGVERQPDAHRPGVPAVSG